MTRHVVIIGAGPAGLGAAVGALRAGARVTLLDTADDPGGQYHRMPPDAYATAHPGRLHRGRRGFERRRGHVLGHPHCAWWPRSTVWAIERRDRGAPHVHVLRGETDGAARERHVLRPDGLVLAPGAHDRVLPFPGWELPGVYTAGAAQALAKGEHLIVGDRVLIAGSGPFLLPVAASLLAAGSTVQAVLEANPAATMARGWLHRPWELAAQPGKGAELAGYLGLLARHRVPYRTGRAVVEARGAGRVEEAVTARLRPDWSVVPGTERTLAVDAVCVTHGFSPQLELPVAAGCRLRDGAFVEVDGDQLTTATDVHAAGEITGIAGAQAAATEGLLAGWIAGGGSPAAAELRPVRRRRDRARAFAARLAAAHPIGAAWRGWLHPGTIVCRCEETTYGTLLRAAADPARDSPHAVKLATRAGLGPCQARICGPTVAELLSRGAAHHRPVAQPIRLGELARHPIEEETKESPR
ncbi:NAD(P)/FAD-dependent oxidoreductase [Actinomadura latina]|uniref:NAD(P)/FAD-dependent oxidoreductase n=1 Tax=Actinomadura latina TaxID=163603 RepID=A0A846YYC9_9ACTN|nr:FAD/NAD(P)-binding oxidoreductase [Actinomadura latina]NKZ05519.1 NAD(P)/FAD-dependent oxidoreductase [Actinomadura latina]